MKSHVTFLAATLAAGFCLIFSAAKAQELPTILQSVWMASTRLNYDPLLVATFILAMTLAVGRTVDVLRAQNHGGESASA